MEDAGNLLRGLAALASDQHHVGRRSLRNGGADGNAPISLGAPGWLRQPLADISDDLCRILVTRVVAGDDDTIGHRFDGTRHLGALAPVAVAASTEDAAEL